VGADERAFGRPGLRALARAPKADGASMTLGAGMPSFTSKMLIDNSARLYGFDARTR
jgi:hypothetical protein